MKLTKKMPARRKTVRYRWCKKDAFTMDEKFRAIRSRFKNQMHTCSWCDHEFINGEMMSLACPEKGKNQMFCSECANELLESEDKNQEATDE